MTSAAILDQLPVLADTIRCRMLLVLQRHELTVSEVCDLLQLPQSTVSRHLKTLLDGGWLTSRREGTSRLYSAAADELAPAHRKLWTLVQEHVTATAAAAQDHQRLRQVLARRRNKSEEFFSSAAGQWDRLREDLFGAHVHLRAVAGLLDDTWSLGDLGCGTGQLTQTLAPFVARVIAVDASTEMLEAARERVRDLPNVELRAGALEQLPVADGELDAAAIVLVLHHVPDPSRALAEAARVLRPGGRLLIVDMLPHDHEEYRQTMGHVWLGFSERQVRRLCEAARLLPGSWHPLPPGHGTKGPALFAATARKATAATRATGRTDE
jgi:ubiquinone/menaquinone biosynthesis C-methylase UbiE/DNA-binding MarR family transcriptional regulator